VVEQIETGVEQQASHLDEVGDQYLTFRLADEDYGIDILRVQEIRGWDDTTRLPNTPEYVRGVINLRGNIVPIYDLRLRFNMPFREYTKNTVVIVIRTEEKNGSSKSIGIVVDAVADVLHGHHIDITRSPDFGSQSVTEAISGLATFDGKMVVLIDVDKLVSEELAVANDVQETEVDTGD
jgi:purine-binding chemotaxis protein CheW